MADTRKVRIAIAIDAEGNFCASGGGEECGEHELGRMGALLAAPENPEGIHSSVPHSATGRAMTCADLAWLDIPGFVAHDGAHQGPDDPHCACWVEPSGPREHGEIACPSEQLDQACRYPQRLAVAGIPLDLCCDCAHPGGVAGLEADLRAAVESGELEISS